MLAGLGASGEVYEEGNHYLVQKTGSAVASLTWGRDLDLCYLLNPRKEHSKQAVAAAKFIDGFFCFPTNKIVIGHSNGGADAAVEAAFSILQGNGGKVVGIDLEATVGSDGPLLVKAKEMLGGYKEVLGTALSKKRRHLAAVTAEFCLANTALVFAETCAAVSADIRPELAYLQGRTIVDRNVYSSDSIVPTNPNAADVIRHDGDHFTMLDPEIIYGNV